MTSIAKDPTYKLLKNALNASSLRHKVVSNNIANINTKNYNANRVVFEERLKEAMGENEIDLKTTQPKHFGFQDSAEGINPKIVKDKDAITKNDGNNVDIDMEMTRLATNQIFYNTLVQQTSKKMSNLRYVIHEGRR